MKNPIKKSFVNKAKKITAICISRVFGDAHFVLKTSADMTARGEGVLVHSLTGRGTNDVIADRHDKTEATQALITKTGALLKKNFKQSFSKPKRKLAPDSTIAAVNGNESMQS